MHLLSPCAEFLLCRLGFHFEVLRGPYSPDPPSKLLVQMLAWLSYAYCQAVHIFQQDEMPQTRLSQSMIKHLRASHSIHYPFLTFLMPCYG